MDLTSSNDAVHHALMGRQGWWMIWRPWWKNTARMRHVIRTSSATTVIACRHAVKAEDVAAMHAPSTRTHSIAIISTDVALKVEDRCRSCWLPLTLLMIPTLMAPHAYNRAKPGVTQSTRCWCNADAWNPTMAPTADFLRSSGPLGNHDIARVAGAA